MISKHTSLAVSGKYHSSATNSLRILKKPVPFYRYKYITLIVVESAAFNNS